MSQYPDTVHRFAPPPRSFTDATDRAWRLRTYPGFDGDEPVPPATDATFEALVAMYEAFDPGDRAQGIPPTDEDRIRQWLAGILAPACVNVVVERRTETSIQATMAERTADAETESATTADTETGTRTGTGTGGGEDGTAVAAETEAEAVAGESASEPLPVVGHATLVPDGDGAYELAIFVLAGYQGAGIGTELLKGLLGAGAAHGIDRVWLTVEPWNGAAKHLYRKVGFETSDATGFETEMMIRLATDPADEPGDAHGEPSDG